MEVEQAIVVGFASPRHESRDGTDDREKQRVTPDLAEAGELELSTRETPHSKRENDEGDESIRSDVEAEKLKARTEPEIRILVHETLGEEQEGDPLQEGHGALDLVFEVELERVAGEHGEGEPRALLALAFDAPPASVAHDA